MSALDIKLMKTQHSGHAYQICKNQIKVGEYDGIIFISGDGLIHEGINGIMSREDKNEFMEQTTFGFIPAWTSNGLIKSILDHNGEQADPKTAAFRIVKGTSMKIDLTELELEYEKERKFMVLSFTWAIICACDLQSEFMRFLGEIRYTLMGIIRVVAR
jgi:sphingosine kinase